MDATPTLDPRAARFLAMLAAGGAAEAGPVGIGERRRSFRALMRGAGRGPDAAVRDLRVRGEVGPLPARLYAPSGRDGDVLPGLVFFHGGGLVSGDLDTHDAICRSLAAAAECRIAAIAYRLAPEHPFPAAPRDAIAAATDVAAHAPELGIDRDRLAVGGDSAGAGLAAIVCQHGRGAGKPPFAAQLLICPVLDAAFDSPSHAQFAKGYFLDRRTLEHDLAANLAQAHDRSDPLLSPMRAPDLGGLPRAIIHTAECDPVRDDGAVYARRLAEAGTPTRYLCHPGMIHLFYALGHVLPQGGAALDNIGTDLKEAFAAA